MVATVPLHAVAQQTSTDLDGDGMLNSEEDKNGDGKVNEGETDPLNADTDGGGEADGSEVSNGRNPLDKSDDMTFDLDNDGLTNAEEDIMGTDRSKTDTDGDSIGDLEDPFPLSRAYKKDTDGDGLPDAYEHANKLRPDVRSDAEEDSDGDGLTNLEEFIEGTDMLNPDSDEDGQTDGEEVEQDSNPLENPCLFHAGPTEKLHDVEEHWSRQFVAALQETKITETGPRIVSGYQTDTGLLFRPNQEITRFELLKIALLGSCITPSENAEEGDFAFDDVTRTARPNETQDAALKRRTIYEAYERGIVGGYPDGSFRPDAPVNRAEALKILFLASALPPFDSGEDYSNRFRDVDTGTWYYPYVEQALSYEFVEGYESDATFRPQNNITRAEAAKIVLFMIISNPHVNGYVIPLDHIEL